MPHNAQFWSLKNLVSSGTQAPRGPPWGCGIPQNQRQTSHAVLTSSGGTHPGMHSCIIYAVWVTIIFFRVDKDRSGQITAIELASALSNGKRLDGTFYYRRRRPKCHDYCIYGVPVIVYRMDFDATWSCTKDVKGGGTWWDDICVIKNWHRRCSGEDRTVYNLI